MVTDIAMGHDEIPKLTEALKSTVGADGKPNRGLLNHIAKNGGTYLNFPSSFAIITEGSTLNTYQVGPAYPFGNIPAEANFLIFKKHRFNFIVAKLTNDEAYLFQLFDPKNYLMNFNFLFKYFPGETHERLVQLVVNTMQGFSERMKELGIHHFNPIVKTPQGTNIIVWPFVNPLDLGFYDLKEIVKIGEESYGVRYQPSRNVLYSSEQEPLTGDIVEPVNPEVLQADHPIREKLIETKIEILEPEVLIFELDDYSIRLIRETESRVDILEITIHKPRTTIRLNLLRQTNHFIILKALIQNGGYLDIPTLEKSIGSKVKPSILTEFRRMLNFEFYRANTLPNDPNLFGLSAPGISFLGNYKYREAIIKEWLDRQQLEFKTIGAYQFAYVPLGNYPDLESLPFAPRNKKGKISGVSDLVYIKSDSSDFLILEPTTIGAEVLETMIRVGENSVLIEAVYPNLTYRKNTNTLTLRNDKIRSFKYFCNKLERRGITTVDQSKTNFILKFPLNLNSRTRYMVVDDDDDIYELAEQ